MSQTQYPADLLITPGKTASSWKNLSRNASAEVTKALLEEEHPAITVETRRGQTRPLAFKEEVSKDRATREQSITEPPVVNNIR